MTRARRPVPFAPVVRLLRMSWRMLGHVTLAAFAVAVALLLGADADVRRQVLVASAFLVGFSFVRAVASEVLSPLRPALRLVPVDDRVALRIQGAVRALLAVLLVTELGAWLVHANGWHGSVASLLGMLRDVSLLVFATSAVWASGLVSRALRAVGEGFLGRLLRFLLPVFLPLAVLVASFEVVARRLGYLPLADWVLDGALGSAAKVTIVAIAYGLARQTLHRSLTLGGAKVEVATQSPPTAAIGAERIAVGLLRLLLGAVATLWVLGGLGLDASSLGNGLDEAVIPGGALSWGRLLGGAVRVALVLLVSWLMRTVLIFFVFPRARVDVGARYAVLAMMRYTVVVLVVFFSLGGLGIETSSLAWFLGAAGVGLGLGLQDVLGNFFSGLVMLVERPIRVGDFVLVGDAAGTVEAIRMRGTLIRTPENTTVLVPNRQLLGERVTNLTYGAAHRRLEVRVGVAYDADPPQVRRILLSAASAHPLVAADPAPFVHLSGFGESSLDFTLFAQSGSPLEVVRVASDLRFTILAELRAASISIPYPQRDVHVVGAAPQER